MNSPERDAALELARNIIKNESPTKAYAMLGHELSALLSRQLLVMHAENEAYQKVLPRPIDELKTNRTVFAKHVSGQWVVGGIRPRVNGGHVFIKTDKVVISLTEICEWIDPESLAALAVRGKK